MARRRFEYLASRAVAPAATAFGDNERAGPAQYGTDGGIHGTSGNQRLVSAGKPSLPYQRHRSLATGIGDPSVGWPVLKGQKQGFQAPKPRLNCGTASTGISETMTGGGRSSRIRIGRPSLLLCPASAPRSDLFTPAGGRPVRQGFRQVGAGILGLLMRQDQIFLTSLRGAG